MERRAQRTVLAQLSVGGLLLVSLVLFAGRRNDVSTLRPSSSKKAAEFFVAASGKKKKKKKRNVSLVLCADPGEMVGYGEADALLAAASEDFGDDPAALPCVRARTLVLAGSKVLLATTGIGATRAALCLDSILREYGDGLKELLFLGTSGGSPAFGGVVDSSDCTERKDPTTVVRLGDVCVSPFATNWDCQRCFWAKEPYGGTQDVAFDSACAAAPCSLHERWDLFGEFSCSFYLDTALADEVLRAARSQNAALQRPSDIADVEAAYWSASTGLSDAWRKAASVQRPTRTFEYGVCSEATSTTYWNGAPYDELARGYVADLINLANERLGLGRHNKTRSDVVAFSAMEGTGWMTVLKLSPLYLHYADLPAANVRGVSDYTHDPLVYDDQVWLEDHDWLDHARRLNSTRAGYRFAIQSTSAVVLSLFRERQRDKQRSKAASAAAAAAPAEEEGKAGR